MLDHLQLSFASTLDVLGQVPIGVHSHPDHRDATQLAELRGVPLGVEGVGAEHVDAGIAFLSGGFHEIEAGDGAELGVEEDGSALLGVCVVVCLYIAPLGVAGRKAGATRDSHLLPHWWEGN